MPAERAAPPRGRFYRGARRPDPRTRTYFVTFESILMILGAVAAFGYGLWAGFGRFDQSQEEIDRALTEKGHRRKATRHFTPLDLVARMTGVSTQRDRRNPFRFEDEDEEETKLGG